ncbi:MAG: LVIVD repeat-containing protein [Gaiellaceae bacterium]
MRSQVLFFLSALVAALVMTSLAGASGPGNDPSQALEARVRAALQRVESPGGHTPAAGRHTRELGNAAVAPVNGDVFAFGDYAYIGAWAEPCDGRGVRILDVSNPASPTEVATAAGYLHTSAEDVEVMHVSTDSFTGDLLAAGIQPCDDEGFGGLALWDVTDPTSPQELGFFGNIGVHELSLTGRSDGVFALLAVPFSEPVTALFFPETIGDFQLVDVSDPANPTLTDDWGATKDGGFPSGVPDFPPPYDCSASLCRGDFPAIFAHSASASADGQTAYLAYWDLGAVVVDISDPTDITYLGRTVYPTASDGDTHSAVANAAGTLLATTDEDFSPFSFGHLPGDTWGFARLWSLSNPSNPTHLSDVTTPHSLTTNLGGIFSAHNPQFDGSKLYVSWYSDGVRIFDVSNATAPREVGFYRPQPNRGVLAPHPIPLNWGVYKAGSSIYLSDMFFGLYIVAEK